MSAEIFEELKDKYPEIIAQMKSPFTSHKFILKLAEQYQVEYVEVLHLSKGRMHKGKSAPFRYVHHQLAIILKAFPQIVKKLEQADSFDIFGNFNRCAEWEKISIE